MKKFDKYIDGAKDIVQGVLKDTKTGNDIRQGITLLEAMPEIEGSILYKMELEATVSYLNKLLLIINDERLDKASMIEEVRKVMDKVQPDTEPQTDETEEQKAIRNVKTIAYRACSGALEELEPA